MFSISFEVEQPKLGNAGENLVHLHFHCHADRFSCSVSLKVKNDQTSSKLSPPL